MYYPRDTVAIKCGSVGEAHAERDDEVSLGERRKRGVMSVLAVHSEEARAVARHRRKSHERAPERGVYPVREREQLLRCLARHDAAAEVDVRLLCGVYQLRSPAQLVLRGKGQRIGADGVGTGLEVPFCGLNVLGYVHEDRSGSARFRYLERGAESIRELAYVLDDEVMLRDGHGHAEYVDLLKAVASDEAARYVARYRYYGYGVEVCGRDARYEVGRAGTRGRDTDSDLARSTRKAVRGMGSALLVRGEYVLYPVTAEIELVEEVDDLTSGESEYGLTALLDERLNYYFCSCYSHNIIFLLNRNQKSVYQVYFNIFLRKNQAKS